MHRSDSRLATSCVFRCSWSLPSDMLCVVCLTMCSQWVIDTPYSSMMHDCGLTKNYAVLIHLPITIDGEVSLLRHWGAHHTSGSL